MRNSRRFFSHLNEKQKERCSEEIICYALWILLFRRNLRLLVILKFLRVCDVVDAVFFFFFSLSLSFSLSSNKLTILTPQQKDGNLYFKSSLTDMMNFDSSFIFMTDIILFTLGRDDWWSVTYYYICLLLIPGILN